jgi:hypothetical protein
MAEDRRYRDDEIAAIFEAAATAKESGRRASSAAGGLTLTELQSIGRDVGVPPERIAEAAAALDRGRDMLPRRRDLGMPISTGRTVDLPRAPTAREWDLLVGELRRTFNAKGKDSSRGDLRSWSNGNLQAHIEPTETGYQLRIGTLKGDAAAVNRLGIGGMLAGLVVFGVVTATSGLDLAGPLVLGGMGAAALTYNAVRLPRWARERERQMEHIAARVRAIVARADPLAGDRAARAERLTGNDA